MHKGECIAPKEATDPPRIDRLYSLPLEEFIAILRSPIVLSTDITELCACCRMRLPKQPVHMYLKNDVLAGSLRILEYHLPSCDQVLVRSAVNIVHSLLSANEDLYDEFVHHDGMPHFTSALRILLSDPDPGNLDFAEPGESSTSGPDGAHSSSALSSVRCLATQSAMFAVIATLAFAIGKDTGGLACAQFVRSGGGPLLVQCLARQLSTQAWGPTQLLCMMVGKMHQHSAASLQALLDAGIFAVLLDVLQCSNYDQELTLPFIAECLRSIASPSPRSSAAAVRDASMRVLPEVVPSFYHVLSLSSDVALPFNTLQDFTCFLGLICSYVRIDPSPKGLGERKLVAQLLRNSKADSIHMLMNGCRNAISSDETTTLYFLSVVHAYFYNADLSVNHDVINAVVIPTVLSALRKYGIVCGGIVVVSCSTLGEIVCECCPQVLEVGGTTAKLLRRLRDFWRSKHKTASRAAQKLLGHLE